VCGHQCTAVSPALLRAVGGREDACRRFCQVRLTLGDNPFGGIACWGGTQAWVELHVPDVYRRGYLATVLPELRATRGGGVSLCAVKLVALAMAQAAEHGTGRGSRLTVATLMARTGLGESTVQRARTALRLLGVATEVFRGRLRTYAERMASARTPSARPADPRAGNRSPWRRRRGPRSDRGLGRDHRGKWRWIHRANESIPLTSSPERESTKRLTTVGAPAVFLQRGRDPAGHPLARWRSLYWPPRTGSLTASTMARNPREGSVQSPPAPR